MRRIALRTCSALFAVSWIVLPGFGVFDLAVTWSADWPQALEAGWGLFAAVVVGAAFVAVTVRPRFASPAVVQLAVAALALAASARSSHRPLTPKTEQARHGTDGARRAAKKPISCSRC